MKILIFGDTHIREENIEELKLIFNEILSINADKVIHLGDYYDRNRPTPKELYFGTKIAKRFYNKYKDVTIISGNGQHDILNNYSIIQYLENIGINTIKGDYIYNNMLFGHFMLNESKLEYGSGRCGIKDLKKYHKVFLGHQHEFEELKRNTIYHIGSVRFCNFNEVNDSYKRIAILENNNIKFIKLKSPYKMLDITNIEKLNDLDKNTKVRLIYSNYNNFKSDINNIPKYKSKFANFKLKLSFDNTLNTSNIKISNKKKKLIDILNEGINKINDNEVKNLLKEIIK